MWLTAEAIRSNQWIPHCPTLKQLKFISAPHREKLYGGAAGGGKSDALLMDALLYADEPGYSAILFRRTYADLALPGALMDRAHEWLGGTSAKWNEQTKTWTFPSGATLTFGYLEHENDKFRYQGAEFQYIGFDETTQFPDSQYRYLRSRLRRGATMRVPLRMGAASNPGGIGHDWVYEWFVVATQQADRVFIPALLDDNPYLDREEYRKSLEGLDETTRAQLLEGRWIKAGEHQPFRPEFWRNKNRYDPYDPNLLDKVVGRWAFFDTANKIEETNAYSAVVIGELLDDYRLIIRYVTQARKTYDDLVEYVADELEPFAGPRSDDKFRAALIEDAASGTQLIQHFTKPATDPIWLRGKVVGRPPYRGSAESVKSGKEQAYAAAGLWCKRDCLWLPIPGTVSWDLHGFERQLYKMPGGQFKDMADSLAGLINYLEETFAAMSTRYYYYGSQAA